MPRQGSRQSVSFTAAAALLGGCILVAPLEDTFTGKPGVGGRAGGGGESGEEALGGAAGAGTPSLGGTTSTGGTAGKSEAGGESGQPPTGDGPCVSNADCIERSHNDSPYRCTSSGQCVALRTSECPLVYDVDAAKDDNPIYVGAFASLPPAAPDTSTTLYPFRLALGEINGVNGGLLMPNRERRPLVMVVCKNCAAGNCDGEAIDAAASHLIDDVGVSSVLATLQPADLLRVFEDHRGEDVFFLSPVGATSALTASLDDDDRVWTMLGQPSDLSVVYRDLVAERIEPYLRNVRGIGSRDLRVVLLRGTDAFLLELSSLVAKELVWNGKSAANNADNYRGFTLDFASLEDTADQLIAFAPDLVISTAGEEVTRRDTGIIWQVETKWSGFVPDDTPLPFWLLSPYNAGDLEGLIQLLQTELKGIDTEATHRFVGITAAGSEDGSLQGAYAVNLKGLFASADPDTGNFYDAFYYLAYAIYAAHEDDPRGAAIARGMHRLLSGDPYDVGLDDIGGVTAALKDDETTIELDGTLGPPAFNADGIRIDPGAVYCFEPSGSLVLMYPDALRYDREAATFTGTFPCFSAFGSP